MRKRFPRLSNQLRIISAIIQVLLIAATLSCSSNETKARKAIEEHLKNNHDIRNLALDLFYPSKKSPGKAYASATITYNFASGSGSLQKEYLGYILRQEGQNWAVEKSVGYTKDTDQAENFIAGIK